MSAHAFCRMGAEALARALLKNDAGLAAKVDFVFSLCPGVALEGHTSITTKALRSNRVLRRVLDFSVQHYYFETNRNIKELMRHLRTRRSRRTPSSNIMVALTSTERTCCMFGISTVVGGNSYDTIGASLYRFGRLC
jgi:hypothetical protein